MSAYPLGILMDDAYEYIHHGLNAREVYRLVRDQLVVPRDCVLYVLGLGEGGRRLVGMKEERAHDLPLLIDERVDGVPVVSLRYVLMSKGFHQGRLDPVAIPDRAFIDMLLEVDTKTGGEFFGELTSKTLPF